MSQKDPSAVHDDPSPGFPYRLVHRAGLLASTHSWELGTAIEAYIEILDTVLPTSIFALDPFPDGTLPVPSPTIYPPLAHAAAAIIYPPSTPTLFPSDHIGVADPCALGVPALLLGQSSPESLAAARAQIDHVLNTAPRLPNGAISHRFDVVEAWADFVYMLPPFFAYAAVAFEEFELLQEAVRQCELYREILLDDAGGSVTRGLWRHIGPFGAEGKTTPNEDRGFWATSNGWAAMGMARVLGVVKVWTSLPFAKNNEIGEMLVAEEKLVAWIREIVDGAMRVDDEDDESNTSGLLRNYLGDKSYFPEVAGTALLAAVVYRVAVLQADIFGADAELGSKYIHWAEAKMEAVTSCVDPRTGIASPMCKSTDHRRRTPLGEGEGVNPEGQCFVGMLGAAWGAWKTRGAGGKTGEL